ncbi:MAG: UDP-N-acetylmuramoyl-L-alanine--D-glutamate ligase [Sphingobacteriia bacterium]|nr:UDP-N-acetylmuramoyl-L-alanine--D-glutamate ligase [Sphingobacteriia bacterium]
MAKRVVILGAGESGAGAAVLATKKGFEVFVSDRGIIEDKYKNVLSHYAISFEEGKHSEERILNADEIIKSPGIPDQASLVVKAKEAGIPVISEIEFAGRYTRARKICITGSNGKTTTTMLIWHILKNAGLDAGLGGNIGKSMAMLLAERDYDYLVLEISSFQLDGMFDFKADVAVLTNITPDHLNRYGYSFEKYAESKLRIIRNQTPDDVFIYCADDQEITSRLEMIKPVSRCFPFSIKSENLAQGAFLKIDKVNYQNSKINININNDTMVMTLKELALSGGHNVYNSMAAAISARVLDIRKESLRQSLSDFQGVEHRLEYVATIRKIEFINDSKATNVNSTWWALENAQKPVIWIAGGQDKGNDYSILAPIVAEKVKAIVCIGVDNSKIIRSLAKHTGVCIETSSMEEAVQTAYKLGQKGDTVLLSPACASFDRFKNYEDRGTQFKKAVINL